MKADLDVRLAWTLYIIVVRVIDLETIVRILPASTSRSSGMMFVGPFVKDVSRSPMGLSWPSTRSKPYQDKRESYQNYGVHRHVVELKPSCINTYYSTVLRSAHSRCDMETAAAILAHGSSRNRNVT